MFTLEMSYLGGSHESLDPFSQYRGECFDSILLALLPRRSRRIAIHFALGLERAHVFDRTRGEEMALKIISKQDSRMACSSGVNFCC